MSWQSDVEDIRTWNKKGGVRGIALRYARVVAQIGTKKCAAEVGCSTTTVGRYTKTWTALANAGYVDHIGDLTPTRIYDREAIGLTQAVWDEFYEAARYTRKDGKKVSKRQPGATEVAAAIEDDPAKEIAAREALARVDARRKLERAKSQSKDTSTAPTIDALVDWMAGERKVTKAFADLLGLTGELPKDSESREIITGALSELREATGRYLDAMDLLSAGKSMDDELAELLSYGAS